MQTACPNPISLVALRSRIEAIELGENRGGAAVAWNGTPLGALLPGGGMRRGSLVEWFGVGRGDGATTLAVESARQACRRGGTCVLIDRAGTLYPPAVCAAGIEPSRLLLVRPASEADEAWALHQALACEAIAAVVAWPTRLPTATFRRLQLAAKAGGALGLLVRPADVRGERSFADARLEVRPRLGWRVQVAARSIRGASRPEQFVELEIDPLKGVVHEASPVHPSAAIRPAASAVGSARA